MNRYSSYSKVPLEWMGEIPSHWTYTKNRFGFKKWKNGKNESENTPVLSLTIKGVKIKTDLSFGKSTESYIGHQLVEKGDIVFTPRDFDQTPILSDVSKYDGCISNLYIVDKSNNTVLNHYINYYWYGLKYSVDYFKNFSHGMRFSFNRFQFDQIPLLIPPKNEQTQIVSFLNTKTQKIDGLIEQTEQKITLLKEKRTSLINHCVTKGLNPNVEMKNSGVEWIGEIPSEWGIKKIKYLKSSKKYSLVDGPFGSNLKTIHYVDDGDVYIIESGFITSGKFQYVRDFKTITNEHFETIKRSECNEGDIIISKIGEYYGMCGILPKLDKRTVISGNSVTLTISKNHNTKFIHQVILQHRINGTFKKEVQQTGQPFISLGVINNLIIPTPNLSEQTQIVEYLDEQTQKIDSTIEKETQRVELLKEYRQSLISEVVTGKVDVRDWKE